MTPIVAPLVVIASGSRLFVCVGAELLFMGPTGSMG
jgi:hypothetical protein